MKKNHTKNINKAQRHILVLRLSAMGDVALTLPVLRGMLQDHPDLHITLLTRSFFAPFFQNIDRLETFEADFSIRHKGIRGLLRLFKEIQGDFECIVDFHDVIRTKFLSFLFQMKGKPVFRINKDRKLKKQYIRSDTVPALKHTINRYLELAEKAGFQTTLFNPPVFSLNHGTDPEVENFMNSLKLDEQKLIGIAPFAKHKLKVWPLKRVRNFIANLHEDPTVQILLFGGGKYEKEQLNILADRYSGCKVVKLSLHAEIALIARLDCMISMDSANMHIAALTGIPVISIWGATHPGMGFSAWQQPDENSLQISTEELSCRPCSIYGMGICHRGDFACMERISAENVISRLKQLEILQ